MLPLAISVRLPLASMGGIELQTDLLSSKLCLACGFSLSKSELQIMVYVQTTRRFRHCPEVTGPCWAYTVYTKEILVCGWILLFYITRDHRCAKRLKSKTEKLQSRNQRWPLPWPAKVVRRYAHFNTQMKTWVLDTTKAAASESKAVQLER